MVSPKAAAKLQARANGKMRKEDEESPERIRVENVENIVTRTKGFMRSKLNGQIDRTLALTPQGRGARSQ
jgi:hypothetical protein